MQEKNVIMSFVFIGVLALSGCAEDIPVQIENGLSVGSCTDPSSPRDNFISRVVLSAQSPADAINELTTGTVNNGGKITDDSYLAAVETITARAESRPPVYGNQEQADYAECARNAAS